MRTTKARRLLAAAAACLALAHAPGVASGHGMMPEQTPVDRIIANLEKKLAERPDDANLHYQIGRAHGLAIELNTDTIGVWDRGDPKEIASRCWNATERAKGEPGPSREALLAHLNGAIEHLNRAIELAPRRSLYRLALASALESGLPLAADATAYPRAPSKPLKWRSATELGALVKDLEKVENQDRVLELLRRPDGEDGRSSRAEAVEELLPIARSKDDPRAAAARRVLAEGWKELIGEEYFRAVTLSLPEDSTFKERPIWGMMDCWTALDASRSFLRVIDGKLAANDRPVREAVCRAVVKAFEGLPAPNAITPIVFPVDGPARLSELEDRSRTVGFDLDASGRGLRWSWVTPRAGILVWDPERTGAVRDGRWLMGSAAWWLMLGDGYDALDALDDNRDGELSGTELAGLAVWVDRNSNGVSDPGEVVPVEQMGVAAIRTRATGVEGGCAANAAGIVMADGRVRPSYDWVATPAAVTKKVAAGGTK